MWIVRPIPKDLKKIKKINKEEQEEEKEELTWHALKLSNAQWAQWAWRLYLGPKSISARLHVDAEQQFDLQLVFFLFIRHIFLPSWTHSKSRYKYTHIYFSSSLNRPHGRLCLQVAMTVFLCVCVYL